MRYATAKAQALPIGSGVVEAIIRDSAGATIDAATTHQP